MRRACGALLLAFVLAGCPPEAPPDDPVDAGPRVDATVRQPDAAPTPDAALFTPLAGVYDETLTNTSDSCGTQWQSPRMFATVVSITETNITFSNSNGTATYSRTGPMMFMAMLGSSQNMGTWTSTMSYEILATYSYTDTGRACTALFRTLGIRRP